MNRAEYNDYLRSATWRRKRESRLRKDKNTCQTCGTRYGLEVHHRTYARAGHERLGDLITLCNTCHSAITRSIKARGLTQDWAETWTEGALGWLVDLLIPNSAVGWAFAIIILALLSLVIFAWAT